MDEVEAALQFDLGHHPRFVGSPGCNVVSKLSGITTSTVLEGQVIHVDVEQEGAYDAALGSAGKERDWAG